MVKMSSKRVLSLFSGCGGMDLGFEGGFSVPSVAINPHFHDKEKYSICGDRAELHRTSFETIFANDILSYAESAWKSFFSKRTPKATELFKNESIIDIVKNHYSSVKPLPQNIDVVTGGFPCQDFSVAGKRKGFESHKNHHNKIIDDAPLEERRGKLYWWMREVISITQPKVFIAENVKGLVSLGEAKSIIQSDFSSIDENGYLVVPAQVLNAANFGVAQNRERIIFIGLNRKFLRPNIAKKIESGDFNIYPEVTHSRDGAGNTKPFTRVEDYLFGLNEPEKADDPAQQKYSKAKYCKGSQGQVEVDLKGLSPTIRAEHHGNIEYRRLSKDKGGRHIKELNSGMSERRLTVRECARIQSFPDEYDFVFTKNSLDYSLSASGAYKVIGNAVPPLLAYNLATHLEKVWADIFFN